MDCLSNVGEDISKLFNSKINAAPVLIKTLWFKDNDNIDMKLYDGINAVNSIKTYEIWRVFLNNDKNKDCYIIISGDYSTQGYRNGKWENISYHGFYSTELEAQNYVNTIQK